MEAPPPLSSAPPIPTTATTAGPPPTTHSNNYPDSVDSSPRSRNTDSWDDPPQPAYATTKLRLMCSYGGHIVPRPHDKSLCYIGGETRIIVSDRHTSLSDLSLRLSKTLLNGRTFTLKYQLPNEDLDSLISISTDEDLENMIEEYDRLSYIYSSTKSSNSSTNVIPSTTKSSRIRLFLFPSGPDSASSIGSLLETTSSKSEDWFLNALNASTNSAGATRVFSESSSVNCLLGLDDDNLGNSNAKDVENNQVEERGKNNSSKNLAAVQDVHSVPDSPMLETTSSFGSTSSSPSLANLPPIRVHVEDNQGQRVAGIEEQFSQMGVGGPNNLQQKQEESGGGGGFVLLASPPAAAAGTVVSGVPVMVGGGEYVNRVYSDDERSDHGGYRKPPQTQLQQQQQQVQLQQQQVHLQQQQLQQQHLQSQQMQKPPGAIDLPSPDSVSSDGSLSNPLSRQKAMMYQETMMQIQSGNIKLSANQVDPKMGSDSSSRAQMQQQQVQESGYVLQGQYDQHPQLHHQQQFVHAGAQYIHHPAGAVAMPSFYPLYPSQQQHHPHHPGLDQQFPVYYVSARPPQAYNLPVQQVSYSESGSPAAPSSRPQTPSPSTMAPPAATYGQARSVPASQPDMAAGAYRTSAAAAPQLVQVPSGQHQPQYVGYSQIHHPSQSIAPTSGATANYVYEYAEPTHPPMYYTQALPPQLAAQYQTMSSTPKVVLHETSAQLPTENVKQQL